MLEIGLGFEEMHGAIQCGKLELALLERDRSVETAEIGMERQARRAALEAGDADASRAAFLKVRDTCRACHAAQGVNFLNDSALFDSTAGF